MAVKMVDPEVQAKIYAEELLKQVKADTVKEIPDSDNFWHVKDLVTKYRLYPEGTEIWARPLKVLEVKKLASLTESNADFILNEILKKATRGLSIDEMYVADKIYLTLFLRANTFRDSSYVVKYNCPKCQKESSYHFGLDMLKINYLSDDYDPTAEYPINNGDVISIRFLKVKDDIEADRFREGLGSTAELDDELLSMACMIATINGHVVPLHQKYLYLTEIDAESFVDITSHIEKYSIGVDPVMNVVCSDCGGTAPMGISFHPSFFVPVRKSA
jgi:hypothetical protein